MMNGALTRVAAAKALTAGGYPISPTTLATMASRGGGPVYRMFFGRSFYLPGDLFAWAESRIGPPRQKASEGHAEPYTS